MAIASSSGIVLINVLMLLTIRHKLDINIYAGLSGFRDLLNEFQRRLKASQEKAVFEDLNEVDK